VIQTGDSFIFMLFGRYRAHRQPVVEFRDGADNFLALDLKGKPAAAPSAY
jgi:hypothetical protein